MAAIEKQINRKVIYKGRIIDVTLDDISIYSGDDMMTSKRELVHHNGGVCALVKLKNGKIPFVKQYRYAFSSELIELPAGKLEKGEEPFQAIIREVEEEVGIIPTKVLDMGKIFVSPGISTEVLYLYYIDEYQDSKQNLDEGEFLDVINMEYDEAYKMIEEGIICDAKTVCLMLKCKKYFEMENK